MKAPKGFGKSYFTFASVLAHSVQNKLQDQTTQYRQLLPYKTFMDSDEQEENEPPDIVINSCTLNLEKPCHCNCYFKRKTKLVVSLYKFIPRCPYYTTHFAFRRTGVHPPQKPSLNN